MTLIAGRQKKATIMMSCMFVAKTPHITVLAIISSVVTMASALHDILCAMESPIATMEVMKTFDTLAVSF